MATRPLHSDHARVEPFFPAGGAGRGIPAPRRRRDECLRRVGAPSTAWGDPATGPEFSTRAALRSGEWCNREPPRHRRVYALQRRGGPRLNEWSMYAEDDDAMRVARPDSD